MEIVDIRRDIAFLDQSVATLDLATGLLERVGHTDDVVQGLFSFDDAIFVVTDDRGTGLALYPLDGGSPLAIGPLPAYVGALAFPVR